MIFSTLNIMLSTLALLFFADRFVLTSVYWANRWHLSPWLIGMTVVAFGTSAPELAITLKAAYAHENAIAIGNGIGSNLLNICVVLGASALLNPLLYDKTTIKPAVLFLLLLTALISGLLISSLTRPYAGPLTLVLGLIFLIWQWRTPSTSTHTPASNAPPINHPLFWWAASCLGLALSAHYLVYHAVIIAHLLGLSTLIIGLTIVALGTSLPELVTTMVSTYRQAHDLALGNIIGSCCFNLTFVLSPALWQHPEQLLSSDVQRDMGWLLLITALFWAWVYVKKNARLSRAFGISMLLLYAIYLFQLISI